MKKLFLLLWLCACMPMAYGQSLPVNSAFNIKKYKVIDTARLIVSYRLYRVNDVENPQKSTHEDMQVLAVGKNISKYYSRYLEDYAKFVSDLIKNGADVVPNNSQIGAVPYEIYKNYPKRGQLTATDVGRLFNEIQYIYEESIPDLSWKLYDEFKEVLGYRCQKATTSFRGRDYTAWFTPDIPVNDGPWKFGGLPGLIMKVIDSENHYDFECVGIEQPKDIVTIRLYDLTYSKIQRKDLAKLYSRMHNNYAAFLNSQGIIFRTSGADGRPTTVSNFPPIPYNPIELE